MLSYEAARAKVVEIVRARMGRLQTEELSFADDPSIALGRVLAENISADRNYPPFNRSTRDGFALRSADAAQPGAKLRLIGESRAGVAFEGVVATGTCVQIMTGAAVPRGADTVVMQEFAQLNGDHVVLQNAAHTGQNFVLAGSESRVGEVVVARGERLGYPELAMAAQVGRATTRGYAPAARRDSFDGRRTRFDRTDARPIPDSQQQQHLARCASCAGGRRAGDVGQRAG